MLNDQGYLAIAELAFYVLALPVSIMVGNKHGYRQSVGWYFLISLSVVRIAGGVLEIVSEEITDPTEGIIIAASTLENLGVSPLLMTTLALLKRVHTDMREKCVDPRLFWVIGLLPTISMVLSIVAATKLGSAIEANVQTGETELQAGCGLLFGTVVLTTLLGLYLWTRYRTIDPKDKSLFIAVLVSLPLLFVRSLYSILSASNFTNTSSIFNRFDGSIWVQVCMAVIEELSIVMIYLYTGLTAPVMQKDPASGGKSQRTKRRRDSGGQYLLMPDQNRQHAGELDQMEVQEAAYNPYRSRSAEALRFDSRA